jgi:hypothetical protein
VSGEIPEAIDQLWDVPGDWARSRQEVLLLALTLTCNTLLLLGMAVIGWRLWSHDDDDRCPQTETPGNEKRCDPCRPNFLADGNRTGRGSPGSRRNIPRRVLSKNMNYVSPWRSRRRFGTSL